MYSLLTFTSLGHEGQVLLGPFEGMHVCITSLQFIYLSKRVGGGIRTQVNSRKKVARCCMIQRTASGAVWNVGKCSNFFSTCMNDLVNDSANGSICCV